VCVQVDQTPAPQDYTWYSIARCSERKRKGEREGKGEREREMAAASLYVEQHRPVL
jgi:hypothetical protein